jgi:hypothetical protein
VPFESQVELFPLVFNQDYIERKFSLENVQPGIFTLSEHNKDIQEQVDDNRKKITRVDTKISELNTEIAGRAKMELTLINNCAARMFKEHLLNGPDSRLFLRERSSREIFMNE